MGLQQFERRLERLVEGAFAKAFRSGLQPVEVGRRLTREMDLRRTVAPRGTLVPNKFFVALSAFDRQRFASFEGELIAELVTAAREHARDEGYLFLGPVEVVLSTDDDLTPGTMLLAGEMAPSEAGPATLVLPDGTRVPVAKDPVTIGRLADCQVVLSDPNVSRRHAEIRKGDEAGGHVVVDLGSTNGTKVNGTLIKNHRLRDGDEITVGATRLRYEAQ
jgi:FHA domain-containing protein